MLYVASKEAFLYKQNSFSRAREVNIPITCFYLVLSNVKLLSFISVATVSSNRDETFELKVSSVARVVGVQKRGGYSTSVVPGLVNGTLRKLNPSQDTSNHGQ